VDAELIPLASDAAQPARIEKLIHLALPVRLIHMQNGGRRIVEFSCTYDIHPRGARLRSSREIKVGDLVIVERGRAKATCRVIWTADPASSLRGQFTVECVEDSKVPWDDELHKLEEQYLPLAPADSLPNVESKGVRDGGRDRRRRPRYQVEGVADCAEISGGACFEARLEQISEFGCQIRAGGAPAPGTNLRLMLDLCDVSVAVRGSVRHSGQNSAIGIAFHEIRQGDRPLLEYVLHRLEPPRREDFADLEVTVTRPAEAG
jgi:hypothetical protein